MSRISEKYKYNTTPSTNPECMVVGDKYRFSVLTERLIRIEYNKDGKFEDRATQIVTNRLFDVPKFSVTEDDKRLIIETDYFILTYLKGKEFTRNSLNIRYTGQNPEMVYEWSWYYGSDPKDDYDVAPTNLKGTARTLDFADGEIPLEDGLLSRGNFTQFDDSKSAILAEDGWIDERGECVDLYVFMYAKDYIEALKAFCQLTGKPPLIPRYALSNMWSRFHKYTQDEYLELMDRFEKEGYPIGVAVVDMDWHLYEYDRSLSSGWTGYSWNKELFPDYKEFLNELHKRKLEVSLNVHPSDGIVAYEDMYEEMAEKMGVDPKTKKPVKFDFANPKFVENYFSVLHHGYEDDGVTFWWIDWQQGITTEIPNADPLWMLNHYHTVDMLSRNRRPMMLSRFSGLGSQRYPVGFSGDTFINWESLEFQPYFTNCSSNVEYGWWSHDIGGHMLGYRDDELMARWTQLGVFSPIFRLHSVSGPFVSKEMWNYNYVTEKTMKKFMRLRHKLIPYLYTMNYQASEECIPLVRPLYYYYPLNGKVYDGEYKNEYYFGSELIVSPITKKADEKTTMAYSDTYLPEGKWFDFFSGRVYDGGRRFKTYRTTEDMPVFAKAGAIIPMAVLEDMERINDISNPESMEILVYPGADNTFMMYEDDGKSLAYQNGDCVKTTFELKWSDKAEFTINKPVGNLELIPQKRKYRIVFKAIEDCEIASVLCDGKNAEYTKDYQNGELTVTISDVSGEVKVVLLNPEIKKNNPREELLELLKYTNDDNNMRNGIYFDLLAAKTREELMYAILMRGADKDVTNSILELLYAQAEDNLR